LVRLPIVSKIKATAFGDSARLEFFGWCFDMARFFQADAVPLLTVARLRLRHLFQGFYSRYHEAIFSQRRRAWVTPARQLSGNAETFAVMPHARREKTEVSSKNVCACGEASGIRRDTDGDYQKKALCKKYF
jgi:hypothetical protein